MADQKQEQEQEQVYPKMWGKTFKPHDHGYGRCDGQFWKLFWCEEDGSLAYQDEELHALSDNEDFDPATEEDKVYSVGVGPLYLLYDGEDRERFSFDLDFDSHEGKCLDKMDSYVIDCAIACHSQLVDRISAMF